MINHNLIDFIEAYQNRNTEFSYNVFTLHYTPRDKNPSSWFFPPLGTRMDRTTINLDEEDLKYLYDKYFPEYEKNIKERNNEIKERKLKEIKELEEQLNRLKNEQ